MHKSNLSPTSLAIVPPLPTTPPPYPSSTEAPLSSQTISLPPVLPTTEDTAPSTYNFAALVQAGPFMQTIRPSSPDDVASFASETLSDVAQDNCSNNIGGGRFPKIPVTPFEYANDYGHRYRECHPGEFDPVVFKYHWSLKPLVFHPKDHKIVIENKFRGIRYRVFPAPGTITGIITRGTVIVIGGQNNADIKYVITVQRAMGPETSLVQANAYTKNQLLYRADHPNWPALLISVPNRFCDVPLHRSIAAYYKGYFMIPPKPSFIQRFVRSFMQFIRRPLFPTLTDLTTVNDAPV